MRQEQQWPRQTARLVENIGWPVARRDLGADCRKHARCIRLIDCLIQAELHQQVCAMRHAMPPAFAIDKAAIICNVFQIGRAGFDQRLALSCHHPRRDAIGSRDLGQDQGGERLAEAVHVQRVR